MANISLEESDASFLTVKIAVAGRVEIIMDPNGVVMEDDREVIGGMSCLVTELVVKDHHRRKMQKSAKLNFAKHSRSIVSRQSKHHVVIKTKTKIQHPKKWVTLRAHLQHFSRRPA